MSENKVITMRFRVSTEERNQIEAKAKVAGLTVSEYVRRVATSQAVAERLPAELRQVVTGVANNLNQLTRYAHLRQFDGKAIDEILLVLKTALR
ncbi:plasmid mobilization protein [Spirosoma spitsbergense]|uniref:plasmid mobilization protein n=1 Tax=Spirosoma spitsbergense TaxID=431554 RepID=UPI000379D1BB|nr:plasmid mobilization relaxosome protein MobC [Spirosoma spitsbergense]